MTKTKKLNHIIIFVILTYLFAISSVESRVGFSGVVLSAEAAPGEHISHDLITTLSSDDASPLNLTVDILEWYQNPSGANLGAKDNPEMAPYSAKNFLSVSPKNFTLKPGTSQNIKIEGNMPAGDGGRYAIIFAHTVPKVGKGEQGVAISVGMNTLVLLTISGSNLIKTGEIENLSLIDPISAKQQNLSMAFRNTGNIHFKVNINASLKDEKGNILAASTPDSGGSIIPTASRRIRFPMTPDSELKPGAYILGVNVTLADGTLLAAKETKFEIKS